jgi:hypothetical protein
MMPEVAATQAKPWNRRMAECMSRSSFEKEEEDADMMEIALEAAGELKCVRLKIMLARCYEMMSESDSSDEKVNLPEGFLDDVLEALK